MQVIPINVDKGEQKYKLYVWRKSTNPYVMSYEEFQESIDELIDIIKQKC